MIGVFVGDGRLLLRRVSALDRQCWQGQRSESVVFPIFSTFFPAILSPKSNPYVHAAVGMLGEGSGGLKKMKLFLPKINT